MGRNLIGYFAAMPDDKQYSVKIISDTSNSEFDEINLDFNSPFVVTYDASKTPFDPIRYSRATINVVADEKFLDVFSDEAQGTRVILTNETDESVEWVGFLTNNLLNMPQDTCGDETFSLEAEDCLSTLDSYDYKILGSHKSIVTFRQLMSSIAQRCSLINEVYIDRSMEDGTGTYINLSRLSISEQNFFSSDTDESWKMNEVLEEICRYLGYTAIQWKDKLYFFDMQSYADATWYGSGDTQSLLNIYKYNKNDGFTQATSGTFPNISKNHSLRQELFKGSNSDISLETVYNKVVVKDSFYEVDHFIPDIYEDENLTNREGEFWTCHNVPTIAYKYYYVNKKGEHKAEKKNENEHIYYQRRFDNKYYTSVYRDKTTLQPKPMLLNGLEVTNAHTTVNTDTAYGVTATFTNHGDHSLQIRTHIEGMNRWWMTDSEGYYEESYDEDEDTFTLAVNASHTINLRISLSIPRQPEPDDEWVAPEYTHSANNWFICEGATNHIIGYVTPDSIETTVGATIVDLATFDKPIDGGEYYNYETDSSIDFNRYIMIAQLDKPDVQSPRWSWTLTTPPYYDYHLRTSQEIDSLFPTVMYLNSGYTNPIIIDNNSFISINATAIYERYSKQYINPDWTDENTGMSSSAIKRWFHKTYGYSTEAPCLVFKLGIGNKWWNGSAWTSTEGAFYVNCSTDYDEETGDTDFAAWWNKEHHVLNNISWTDWAGINGYKIPLSSSLDFSQPIHFEVKLPSKLQVVDTRETNNGFNGFCWIKDFKIDYATKDSEKYDVADVVYENVIDENSVNELSDVTCKITTYPNKGMHSYSNVALDGNLINNMIKTGLDGIANKPEENIIKAYVNQYRTPTIKEKITLDMSITPFSRIKDSYYGKYFGVLGQVIDYAAGKQDITLIETKEYTEDDI